MQFRPTRQTYKDEAIPAERGLTQDNISRNQPRAWMGGAQYAVGRDMFGASTDPQQLNQSDNTLAGNADVSQGHPETSQDVHRKSDRVTGLPDNGIYGGISKDLAAGGEQGEDEVHSSDIPQMYADSVSGGIAGGGNISAGDGSQGTGLDEIMNQVDQAFQYGRARHGIGDQSNQSATQGQDNQQQAPATPSAIPDEEDGEQGSDQEGGEQSVALADGGDPADVAQEAIQGTSDGNVAIPEGAAGDTNAAFAPDQSAQAAQGDQGDQTPYQVAGPAGGIGSDTATSQDQQDHQPGLLSRIGHAIKTLPSPVPDDDTIKSGLNKMAGYVMGAGSMAHDAAQALLAKAQGATQDERVLNALKLAGEQAGTIGRGIQDAAGQAGAAAKQWALIQYYRTVFQSAKSYAEAALIGNEKKPPNLQDSVKAANGAFPYVPDDTQVKFTAMPDNQHVGVLVTKLGDNKPLFQRTLDLSQYNSLLKNGDFDTMYEKGPAQFLKNVTQYGTPVQQYQTPFQSAPLPQGWPSQTPGYKSQTMIPQPGQPGYQAPPQPPEPGHENQNRYTTPGVEGAMYVDKALDVEAHRRFPGVAQVGPRMDWIRAQQQQAEVNKVNEMKAANPLGVQNLRNAGALERTQAGGQLKAAWENQRTQAQVATALAKLAADRSNRQLANAAGVARSMLVGGVDPANVPDVFEKMTGGQKLSDFINLRNQDLTYGQGAQPAQARTMQPAQQPANTQVQDPFAAANQAIQKQADPAQVVARLRQMGFDDATIKAKLGIQ